MDHLEVPTRAVILAAGRGRRLRPYTDTVPKPLLSFDSRSQVAAPSYSNHPTLHTILDALAETAVGDVCLITHYLAEQIEAYVGDGAAWGMRAVYRRQPALLGTAHALQTAVDFITTPCFVIAADYRLPPGYLLELQAAYVAGGAPLAVSLKQLPPDEVGQRSSVKLDGDGRILEIVEKPEPGQAPSLVGASLLYIVPPAITHYLTDLALSPREEYELPTVINRMLADGYEMTGCLQAAPLEWSPLV